MKVSNLRMKHFKNCKRALLLDCVPLEDGSTTTLRNVRDYVPVDMVHIPEELHFRHFRWEDMKYRDDIHSDYFENVFTN